MLDNDLENWISSNGVNEYKYSAAAEEGEESYLSRPLRDKARVIKVLSSLSANKYVSFISPKGFDSKFQIELLPEGLLRAEKLDSSFGKLELFYSDNKNGIIGLLLTATVSAFVSLITTMLSK